MTPAGERARISRTQAGALLIILLIGAGCSEQRDEVSKHEPVRTAVDPTPMLDLTPAIDALPLHDRDAVRAFYAARHHKPAWLGPECEVRLAALRREIGAVTEHGLTPAHYHAGGLAQVACDSNGEVLASDAWMALASDLHRGRVDRVKVEPHWNLPRRAFNAPAALQSAAQTSQVAAILPWLAPQDDYYRALRDMLALQRQLAASGGWPSISQGSKLQRGDRGERVDQLRRRLDADALLDQTAVVPGLPFDDVLEEAVEAFQRRSNIDADGVAGHATLALLNKSVEERIAQLRANLERLRWMQSMPRTRHVRVFIADFHLETWDESGLVREHKVIVGKRYRTTPSFAGKIERVVFAPRWHVPRRLVVEDKLPLFQKDPQAFHRLGYELFKPNGEPVQDEVNWHAYTADDFPFRLRQRPGTANALGNVKILFPNENAVYLHDTPQRALFAKTRRDFSSGCIRVDDALGLAGWLLQDDARWNRAAIDAAVAAGQESTVRLKQEMPIFITYLTVSYDERRYVRLLEDLYERDPAVVRALDAA